MAKKILFTQEQLDQMVQMHQNGFLNREIAEAFHTSRGTIDRRLAEMNVPSRHPWVTPEKEQQVILLYEQYHSLQRVGNELRMNAKTIREVLVKHNQYIYTASENHTIKTVDESYFEVIDSHRKAYYLGLLYADGTIDGNSPKVAIALQEQDKNILFQFREDLKSDYSISYRQYKNPKHSNQYVFTMTNHKIHDDLIQLGMIPRKSYLCKFPKGIIEPQYYSSFILGYLDGDGYISKNPKECRVQLVGTESFCYELSVILKEALNIHASVLYCHKNKNTSTRTLQIAGRNQVKTFLDWIYSSCDVYLERKYQRYFDMYCTA